MFSAASAVIIQEAGGYVGTISALPELIWYRPIPVIAANTEENFRKLTEIVNRHVPVMSY